MAKDGVIVEFDYQDGRHMRKTIRNWHGPFLAALRLTGNVERACNMADVGRRTVARHKAEDPEFAVEFDDAMDTFADILEDELIRRALHGDKKMVIYKGQACGVWIDEDNRIVAEGTPGCRLVPLMTTEYSDALIALAVKAKKKQYREGDKKDTNVSVTNVVGSAVTITPEQLSKMPYDELVRLHKAALAGEDITVKKTSEE